MIKAMRQVILGLCGIIAVSVLILLNVINVNAKGLSNPKIEPDSSMNAGQKVSWDCIWFGEYPQSEVTSKDAVYSKLQNATGWDSNGDVQIDGEKYRRIKKEDANYVKNDSEYYYNWSDGIIYHYFKYEPIKWRVLNITDNQAFVISDMALDDKEYNIELTSVSWKNSTIRSWLNGYGSSINKFGKDFGDNGFMEKAFSLNEKKAILETLVVNDKYNYGWVNEANNTYDKIYLLSYSEVCDTDESLLYGFQDLPLNSPDVTKACKCSTYAFAMGAFQMTGLKSKDNCSWWLRTKGDDDSKATLVSYDPFQVSCGYNVDAKDYAVRPVLNLNLLLEDQYSYAGTVCSDGTVNEVEKVEDDNKTETTTETTAETTAETTTETTEAIKPVEEMTIRNPVYKSDTKTSVYSYVYFGHYPQSEIKGDDITSAIVNANYYIYNDLGDGIGIADRQQIWRIRDGEDNPSFKYYLFEPIRWKVLAVNNQYLYLMSDAILDHGVTYEPGSSYSSSGLRSWLNAYDASYNDEEVDATKTFTSFVSTAFTQEEYDDCIMQKIQGGSSSFSDYVTIPFNAMVKNNVYGFYEGISANSTRVKKASDYAKECAQFSIFSAEVNGWYTMDDIVSSTGAFGSYSYIHGIVPVIKVRTDSELYSTEIPVLTMGKNIEGYQCNLKYNEIDYNGTEKKPAVTLKDGTTVLQESVDYTVEYKNNIKTGTATAIIKGAGNYFGTIEKSFIINGIAQTISNVDECYQRTYGDSSFRLNACTSADGIITYKSSDESVVVVAPRTGRITIMGPGIATIVVTASKTDNYNMSEKNIKFVVLPSTVSGVSKVSATSSTVTIKWNPVFGASAYEIFSYNPLYEEYQSICTVNSNETSVKLSNLKADTTYKFKVRALKNTINTKISGTKSKVCTVKTNDVPKSQTIKLLTKNKTVKLAKLKRSDQSFMIKVSAKTGVSFRKISGNKKIFVNTKGKVIVKKGLKKGNYKIKLLINARENSIYKEVSVYKNITIKIKK